MIHDEACIAQEQSSLLNVKCLFVLYLPKHVKSKRVKISNYKWLYSLNISYINIITIYSLLCFAVLEAVTLMLVLSTLTW